MKALFLAFALLPLCAPLAADEAEPTATPVPQPLTLEGDKALAAGQFALAEKDYLKATDSDPSDHDRVTD